MNRRNFLKTLALGIAVAALRVMKISSSTESAPQTQTATLPGSEWGFPLTFPAYFPVKPLNNKIYLPEVHHDTV